MHIYNMNDVIGISGLESVYADELRGKDGVETVSYTHLHLSLKDNSAIDKLDKQQAIGVASAKIEGRLRTPEYVAAAVSACLAGP